VRWAPVVCLHQVFLSFKTKLWFLSSIVSIACILVCKCGFVIQFMGPILTRPNQLVVPYASSLGLWCWRKSLCFRVDFQHCFICECQFQKEEEKKETEKQTKYVYTNAHRTSYVIIAKSTFEISFQSPYRSTMMNPIRWGV